MSVDAADTREGRIPPAMDRYDPLGLIANPFRGSPGAKLPVTQCEIRAASNRMLVAIHRASFEDAPRPIWIEKGDVPRAYPTAANASAENSLATDDALNVLYGSVPLFLFRQGVTRATLGMLAERISFRSVQKTIAAYVEKVLETPDDSLTSFQVIGPEGLTAFTDEFREDRDAVVARIFGSPEVERVKELIGVADFRKSDLEGDGEETDRTEELDETIGDAPGTSMLLAMAAEDASQDTAILDYLVEYTKVHLSPVIARALRMYRERGMSAMAEELKVTKAPRKTLSALVEFSKIRYRKVAFIYNEFQSWKEVPEELRSQVAGSLASIRWKVAAGAVMVFIASPGEAPELEEMFGGGERLVWDFRNLEAIQAQPDVLDSDVVDDWLESAVLPDRERLTMQHPVLARLAEDAEGSFSAFIELAREAIEDAARRGVGLDEQAADAARRALRSAEQG